MSNTKNRITYIEPNNLPSEFAAKSSNGVKLDNITWAPEDLNISVDLQVIIPSRIYRKSDNFDIFNIDDSNIEKISILSGEKLKDNKSFLTDDYTTISYQEIKNNNKGSKELLGINSIHISFDSHMYPRVTMNFTDVRGASLMMPQEYNLEKDKNEKVCQSFFQSFFKFPYPRFLLSVKGIYGTCVSFVLSVDDFKATFNSETGNFDVVVTFIGLMYGLYTDIPMNYLIMAPYIGSTNKNLTNEYWASKTKPGGEFFFKEKDGIESKPISTFFEFRNNYKNLISLEEGNNDFVFGANIMELSRVQEEILALTELKDCFDNIEDNCETKLNTEIFNFSLETNRIHIVFLTGGKENTLSFKTAFVNNFTNQLKAFNEKYDGLGIKTEDVPGTLSNGTETVNTVNLTDGSFFICNNEKKYVLRKDTELYQYLYGKDKIIREIENAVNNPNASNQLPDCSCVVYYDDTFKNVILERLSKLNERVNKLEESASKEMQELFRNSCNFTPSVENVMRMVFAHLDTFLYEFYSVLETISKKDRRIGKDIRWDILKTDIQSSSSDATVPPFTAFYKKKDNQNDEIFYPGQEALLKGLEEVSFVENIFNGLEEKLKDEAKRAQNKGSKDIIPDISGENSNFTPIAVTDYFYYQASPYSKINEYDSPCKFWTFVLNRLYVGFRDFEDKKTREKIIDIEFNNLKSSNIWNKIVSDDKFKNTSLETFENYLKKNDYTYVKTFSFLNKYVRKNSFSSNGFEIRLFDKDYFKFDGLKNLQDDDVTYGSYSRNGLDKRFRTAEQEELNRITLFRQSLKDEGSKSYFLKTKIDKDTVLRRDCTDNVKSILLPLDGNGAEKEPVAYNIETSDFCLYKQERSNGKYILVPTEKHIKKVNGSDIDINNLFKSENCWVPCVTTTHKGKIVNIFFNEYEKEKWNPLFIEDKDLEVSKSSGTILDIDKKYVRALWFLSKILEYESVNLDMGYKTDHIYHIQKLVLLYIGGYYYIIDNKLEGRFVNEITKVKKVVSCVPEFLEDSEKADFKLSFVKWVGSAFEGNNGILKGIRDEVSGYSNKEVFQYKVVPAWGYYPTKNSKPFVVSALSPKNTLLQEKLVKLIQEDCWIFSFPNYKEKDKKPNDLLLTISEKDFTKFFYKVRNELEKNSGNDNNVVVSSNNNMPQSHATDNDKLSLYITLKNLYDRWLSTYTHNNFKLRNPNDNLRRSDRSAYSEFDNFLYVDSFYNNIGSEFMINPKTYYDIVNDQIAGTTNYNVLDFIGKICQDNKLLFRCLPVYDNLYSEETFKDIFRPLSLYNGADKLHRRIGNTYLLMYTYEPSSKLNIPQDKTNDVSYLQDSFVFVNANGVTEEAAKLFNGDGENICAFSVTPGMQNQSYFTKISVGMDNPRVTDISIKNKFSLADSVRGGRSEGIGTGQDLFTLYSNRSYDCNVEMLGCVNIMPMMYFQLNNVPMFKGAYMITKVEHNIQNNTMTTKFTGTRLSRYAIPFNKSLFSLQGLSEIINSLKENNASNKFTIGTITVEITNDGDFSYVKGSEEIPQPKGITPSEVSEQFNVWAAINQMAQCLRTSSNPNYIPLTYDYSSKKAVTNEAICATAVETFLMAGFNGVFGANNQSQAQYIESHFRTVNNFNGKSYTGRNGYDMKHKLSEFGFFCIAAGENDVNACKKQAGDVCVMRHGEYGHVCMFTGKDWISDFKQNNGWNAYSGNPHYPNTSDVLLYRHPNLISKPQIYGYFKEGVWTPNYMNNKGFDIPGDVLRFGNVVE